jgi:V8-like Glu-specific endopeptidase
MRFCAALCLALLLAVPAVASDDALASGTLGALKDATVYVKVEKGDDRASGSGFLVRSSGDTGYVVTNHHVVTLTHKVQNVSRAHVTRNGRILRVAPPVERIEEVEIDNPTVTVVFSSGTRDERSFSGEVVAADAKVDLAVIKVTGVKDLPRPIDLSREAELSETVTVYAVGFPLGQLLATSKRGPAVSVTKGTITSVRRNDRDEVAIVQIDSDLNPGNSGGPVVDATGRLVGIAVAKVRDTRIGLAIPPRILTGMLDGRVGEARLTTAGRDEVRVQVDLFDPLQKLRSIAVYYTPEAATGATGALNAHHVDLTRQGRRATGSFKFDVPEHGEKTLTYQVAWVSADDKDHRGERRSFVAKAPAPAPPVVEKSPVPPPDKPAAKNAEAAIAPDRPATRPAGSALTDAQLSTALDDLLDPAKAQGAAERLARAKPDAGRRQAVVRALKAVASEKDFNVFARSNSVKALGFWGSEPDIDFLVPLASDGNIFVRSEALDALSWLGGTKAAEAIAERIDGVHDRARVLKCLARMGPAAEGAVVSTLLGSSKVATRLDGCKLLKSIGTDKSLHALDEAARTDTSDAVRLAAETAVKSIQDRRPGGGK